MYLTLNIVHQSSTATDLMWWVGFLLDEFQVWTYSNCKFVYQYRDFFNKSYAHDFNVPCGKTQIGCCFLRDMLLLLFAHSFKFKYMQSVSHRSL